MNKHRLSPCTKSVQPLFRGCTTFFDVAIVLRALHDGDGQTGRTGWREVAQLPGLDGRIKFATLSGYAREDRPIVNEEHRRIFGLPCKVKIDPCPHCQQAPTVCLCDGSTVRQPSTNGARKRGKRTEISEGTPVESIPDRLYRVTGRRFCLDERK